MWAAPGFISPYVVLYLFTYCLETCLRLRVCIHLIHHQGHLQHIVGESPPALQLVVYSDSGDRIVWSGSVVDTLDLSCPASVSR